MLVLGPDTVAQVKEVLGSDGGVVACLCAAWCKTCEGYQSQFQALADRHRELQFLWVDIEDCADLIGDVDVETFPTLLLQKGATVQFSGAVPPQIAHAERLIEARNNLLPVPTGADGESIDLLAALNRAGRGARNSAAGPA